jgi:hypothetical protein
MKLQRTAFRSFAAAAAAILFLRGEAAAEATLLVGTATAAPGAAEVAIPISIEIDPGEEIVTGIQLTVSYDAAVLGGTSIVPVDEVDRYWHLDQSTYVDAGNVGAAFIWDIYGEGGGVEASGVLAHLRFCVLETAAPGVYPIEVLAEAERRIPGGPLDFATVYTAAAASVRPLLEPGAVTIEGPPVAGGSCEPDDRTPPGPPPPPPPLPDPLEASYRLAGASARPGGSLTLPFTLRANAEVASFSFSVDFDEEVLQGLAVDDVFEVPAGTRNGFLKVAIDNANDSPGNGGVDEGFIAGAVVFGSLDGEIVVLPRDTDNDVFAFQLAVAPEASPGVTEVRFLEGGRTAPSGQPVPNVVTIYHVSVPPDDEAAMVSITDAVNGLIAIVGDASAFVRGDANGDSKVNISDAQRTLNYLFLGGEPPACFDAADANDDGELNMSDPIRTLGMLFLGSEPLPPPTAQEPDLDPTPDAMTCLFRDSGS